MIDGFDCSNYGGIPTMEQAVAIREAGYEFAIVGCQNERIARGQLRAFKTVEMGLGLYVYPYYDENDGERVERAKRLGGEFGVRYAFDDIEWDREHDGPQPPPFRVVDGIDARIRAYRTDFDPGIYSSESEWPSMTHGMIDCSHLPLMSAFYYYDRRKPELSAFRPYGGWQEPLIWQWHDTTSVATFGMDLNIAGSRFWEGNVDEQKERELGERRAKAILDLNLLLEYRTEFAGPPEAPTQAVTLRLNDGTYLLTVPTPRQP